MPPTSFSDEEKDRSFCVLPFFAFEIGEAKNSKKNIYCCRLPPGSNIENVKADMLNNQRSPDCSICWDLEDRGLTSERNLHNSALDFYWDRDINFIKQDVKEGNYTTRIVKLASSNLCNGTCVTCGAHSSSAWANLEGKKIDYTQISLDDLSHINWQEIISLGFVGGEPLLERVNFQILEKLLSHENDRCFINIVTNGSISLTPQQLSLLSRFKNLNICLSIDGIEERFEYLRFPLKWSSLLTNLGKFRKITDNISVSCMISNMSIFYLDETLDWFHSENLKYLCKQISHPLYFSPGNLPPHVKKDLLQTTRYPQEMQTFLNCGSFREQSWNDFLQEITRQDLLKKISVKDFLPKLNLIRTV